MPAHTTPPASALRTGGIGLCLFGFTLLVFSRVLTCDFVNYDDPIYVFENAHVQSGLNWAGIHWAFTSGDACNWHPLTWLSHMLDCQLYGLNPWGHHATSLVLHAVNAVLVFLVLRRLALAGGPNLDNKPLSTSNKKNTATCAPPDTTSRMDWAAAFGAALFALHPLRVESAAWIAERKDLLSGLFFLLTLWFYSAHADQRNRNKAGPRLPYAAALLSYSLGLLCKPMLVTMPFLLLLLDFWPLGRTTKPSTHTAQDTWKKLVIEKLPFFALAALSCVITYRVQQAGGAVSTTFPLPGRIENAFVVILRYLSSFVWPFSLCSFYPYVPILPRTLVIGSVPAVLSITTTAIWQLRRRPWLAVGWFWYLGMLIPVIGIVQVGAQSMADRYTYLPMIGLMLPCVALLASRPQTSRFYRFIPAISILLLGALSARTYDQIATWKDSLTLSKHSLTVTKDNWSAAQNCGSALADQRRFAEALPYLSEALRLNPTNSITIFNYAQILHALGRDDEALPYYKRSLELKPSDGEAAVTCASILARKGNNDEAETVLQKTLQANPNYAPAHNALALLLLQKGHLHEAENSFLNVIRLTPNDTKALASLGGTLCAQNQFKEGLRYLEAAYSIDPSLPELGERIAELRKLSPAATNP